MEEHVLVLTEGTMAPFSKTDQFVPCLLTHEGLFSILDIRLWCARSAHRIHNTSVRSEGVEAVAETAVLPHADRATGSTTVCPLAAREEAACFCLSVSPPSHTPRGEGTTSLAVGGRVPCRGPACPTTQFSFFPLWMQDLFKMVTFMDKTTRGRRYLYIQPSENDVEGEETKLPICNPITSLCKSDCVRVRDAGCICPYTFNIASLMASAKNFDAYELVGEASSSPGMVKFSGLGRAKSFQLEEARELTGSGRGFCWHSSIINRLRKLSWMTLSYGRLTLLILLAFVQVLSLTVVKTTSSWNTIFPTNSVDILVSIRMFLLICTSIIFLIRKQCFAIIICSHAMEQGPKSYFLGDVIYSRGIPLMYFVNGGPRCSSLHMPVIPRGNEVIYLTQTFQRMKANLVLKLKIVRSRKPLEPFVPPMEDGSSRVKIPGIGVVIPTMPIPVIPIQSLTPLLQDELPVGVCVPSTKKEVDKNAARVFGKAIFDKVCRTPFDRLSSLIGDFDSLYATILQRGVHVTPLESKVERLIKQACDFKDLQQSYFGRISAEEHDSCRMEV
ncbi:hypothetical protein Cgig2_017798 [Carnegiea gigantea]|uniref:Uncharacterized protein n=1 Tax=Carnegiea gigantea TaxID=171969 RepID=A0A9Q1QR26_9CARY|nr:hypothetical protein Cgig2_017798 [Carnegiea gigantea]